LQESHLRKLESDSAIQDEFNRLDNKMIQQACFNCSKKYNELIQNIEKAIRQNRYDELAGNLQEAIELGEENRGCMLDLSKAKAFQIQYQKLLDYNKRYNEVMQAMYSQGFGTAISIYEKLDEDIALFSLDEYGITHLKIIQFVDNQNNSGLTRIALQYFLAKNDVQNAYACFTSLQKQTMDDNETEKIQISLAEQLARRDAESAQNISAEQLSLGYFGEDKRNRTLRQTYLKVFKSTQRM
jgi:tetratricopeptide (TPR) repeat protein